MYLLTSVCTYRPNWGSSVAACLTNATVVGELLNQLNSEVKSVTLISCGEISRLRSIEQLWRLLAVSLDMYDLSDVKESDEDDGTATAANLDLMSAWTTSALGRPLLTRLVGYLLECNGQQQCNSSGSFTGSGILSLGLDVKEVHPSSLFDVQSLATVICIVGNVARLIDMISDEVS